ncbi:MAG: PEP-CTERM sorting domain-containing protein [Nitrosomonas sp.]|uniref:PEP-CTERM sorting domain-containing protein n=1 Tax=Nitrosomonas sp. TaxID=42353 RepID=UPI00272FD509|nr:PEP-CTERM sorting domain-containing protein [Nitrosomonas sp.]MDP1550639.1 PEP-CTERM sorting domain-containing protein [Nitrosomonas sp.]
MINKNIYLIAMLGVWILSLGLIPTANAALEPRLNGQAYYDTDLDITWLANSDVTDGGGSFLGAGYHVYNLIIEGISGWRLPSADVNGDGFIVDCFGGGVANCSDNEMGYLYWEEGITSATPGVFNHISSDEDYALSPVIVYFFIAGSTTFYEGDAEALYNGTFDLGFLDTGSGPTFSFRNGRNSGMEITGPALGWAVHSGDVAQIPEPETYAMLLAGLGLIGFIAGRRKESGL